MSFDSLGLSAELCNAVRENGYTQPTPIQAQSIPVILEGRDILAGAQTGTGKTAGFTLPLLQKLSTNLQNSNHRGVRALVLTPTRELAAQVADSVSLYSKFLPLKSMAVFGGVKINPQIQKLRRGVDILVATPGRLLDHANQRTVDLSKVEVLVLDEADRMLDMGFINDIKKIMAMMPKHRQNLLFSATFSNSIKSLANSLLHSPVHIEVNTRNKTAENVAQTVYQVDRKRKRELLSYIIGSQDWKQVLVFTRTKYGADRLSKQLEKDGLGAMAIHGDKSQGARTRALSKFKQGKIQILVATDIAARGLDISQLPHVVNFDLPDSAEDYVHRIGRTGRAGNEGEALSLVCIDELKLLKDVEQLINRKLTIEVVEGYEPDPSIKAQPVKAKKSRRRSSSGSSAGANNSGRPASRSRNGNRSSNVSKTSSKRKKPRKQSSAAVTGNDSEQNQNTPYKKKRRKPSRQVPALLGG